MSILIKGINMPKNCDECICNYDWHCMVTLKNLFFVDSAKRLDDCPLIELPPHDRLIDADALAIALDNADELTSGVLSVIDNAPTIIETEGEP